MTETMHLIAPYLGASTLAWVVYCLASNLRIRPKVRRALEDYYASTGIAQQSISSSEQIGIRIAERLPFSFTSWEEHLKWAQRGGYFTAWGVGRLLFTAMIYAGISTCVLLVNPVPLALLVPLCAAAYPFLSVRCQGQHGAQARRARPA